MSWIPFTANGPFASSRRRTRQSRPPLPRSTIYALEPRVLLDAAAVRTAQETAQHAAAGTTEAPQGAAPDAHPDHAELVSALDAAQRAASADTSAAAAPPVAVYFIERSLADSAQLAQSLPPGAEVHYIEPGTDGVQFIAQTLQGRSDVDAIHIFSHGAGGALQLGTASVGIEQMQADYRGELEAIDRVATPRNVPVVIDVLANDSFEGPNPLVTAVNGLPISVGQSVAVAHGVVTLNADGTLTYVPNASYQSEDFFTYTVTSGGVTETATVHVVVPVPPRQDFVQVFLPPDPHEKPPGRLPIDSLFVEPAVITAANGQDWLGGTQTLNGASGAVLQAANSVDSLEGLNTLTERGIVIAAVNDLEALDGIDTRDRGRHGEWIRAQLADGSRPAPDFVSTLILRDGVRLELMQHGSRLWIDVQHNVRELRAVLADGRPLPPWVRVDARGFLVIDRPADSETLRLRLTIVPERGATRTHTIEIDMNSGQMQESGARETSRQGGRAMPAHHAAQAPGLDFYLQLDMAADRIAAQDADLMALLETP